MLKNWGILNNMTTICIVGDANLTGGSVCVCPCWKFAVYSKPIGDFCINCHYRIRTFCQSVRLVLWTDHQAVYPFVRLFFVDLSTRPQSVGMHLLCSYIMVHRSICMPLLGIFTVNFLYYSSSSIYSVPLYWFYLIIFISYAIY